MASLNLSLNTLRAEDENAWQAFVWLGVLPEDVQVTAPMAATLWEMEQAEAAETLELLWSDALLLPGSLAWIGEQQWPSYRLHDLLHDIARRLLAAAPPCGLGYDLVAAHAALLERYHKRTKNSLWHTLPDDGYIHAHLTWHMEQDGQVQQIHALLREETAEGRNGWYDARERLGQQAGFFTDVARAWRLAEKEFISFQSPISIGLQCRYALITASLNNIAINTPPTLLAALVENRIWTPAQGIAYAKQVPNPKQKAEALEKLVAHLPAGLLDEAQATAYGIEDIKALGQVLSGISLRLAKLGSPEDALALANKIENLDRRVRTLEELVPNLPVEMLGEVLAMVPEMGSDWMKTRLMVTLAPHLTSELLEEALTVMQKISDFRNWAKTLVSMVPYFSEELRSQAIQLLLPLAPKIGSKGGSQVLIGLAPYLSEESLAEALILARRFWLSKYGMCQ